LPWTSRDVTNLREVPRRVLIVGGGVVACESATWLRGLGAEEVTLVVRGPRLLEALEPFAGEAVAASFHERGITVLTGAAVESVSRPDVKDTGIGLTHGGPVTISVAGKAIEVDEVVVAAGRTPASDGIGLETVGVSANDRGFLDVDDHMEVAGGWLYAIGDLCGRALLTHMGKYQARICGDVIAARAEGRSTEGGRYRDLADHDMVPAVVFCAPEVASVGLTEAKARDKGIDVELLTYEIGNVAGASLLRDGYQGRAQLVVDRSTDLLVGATFVGPDVAELLHAATTAIVGRVTTAMLWHVVPSYPTMSEVWLRLLEQRNPS
jgi:pyruvate/2-oxoglutarate dehydrogenase complex dihydrolipoamide dehydrogenase (E3) component